MLHKLLSTFGNFHLFFYRHLIKKEMRKVITFFLIYTFLKRNLCMKKVKKKKKKKKKKI